jgi:hypothetical protein
MGIAELRYNGGKAFLIVARSYCKATKRLKTLVSRERPTDLKHLSDHSGLPNPASAHNTT